MPDPRFFNRTGPFSLSDLARLTGASLAEGGQESFCIADVAPLDAAGPEDLSFLDNVRYREAFTRTCAGAVLVAPALAPLAPSGVRLLLTPSPYRAYALAAQAFYPDSPAKAQGEVSTSAVVDSEAVLGPGCVVEAGAVVGKGARIGARTCIGANAVVGRNVEIGEDCQIGAGASLSHCLVGSHVRIYPGARIGQDGFGFAIDPAGHVKVPQLGRVLIGDGVEIGSNTCIDRGAGPDTIIGNGAWIDNLVQIGHNVRIGRGCVIVAQAGVSGSTVLEDYAVLAGQAGVAGHLRVGKGARIAAQSGIMRDVPAGAEVMGSPAVPLRQYMRQVAMLSRLSGRKNSQNGEGGKDGE
jgi:UDP-3-O-[3-hydroxymyristoyl] glucosamine N-acyltransferase